ncbi:GNAT family N-acetyltransferase [Streptomyces griseus]|uniref:N-acetyltransferase domain-containing protein n=1 Tax=Streptomyces griseus subsp. griseus (strain JCM 4626 / CBS 651.72 / NBRC 13350 / KCC S-0626 / ISP 5235) TaxID=455632 RepID=B1VPE1_STRGG|nr:MULTISPECIES: GNAT family N-acetyltransferase [Streptomyces]MYR51356.1 GNAT family N-acetyltransferase [Streptomyces sp. SID4928]MYT81494.1 GNAT family N-acetyltransferase [Streptomyces sp. SID8364]EGE43318.1 GCN5-related N-acetyltransferase [Streptomyces sp. ACT-1]MBW3706169.1 GNAT family N-acetyltransferase [Streptomyces griseus]SBV07174.1 Acetyltransferase (GNAT) family protein [Streptomyces sp. MnatMP-M77]
MGRRLVPLTLDNLPDLPERCRSCVFWELDPVSGEAAVKAGKPKLEKEAWISAVLLEWGSCGRVVYVDDVPAGFVLYAPPAYVPRSTAFPTSPVSPDAVQLITGLIVPAYQGQGLGRVLVQTVAKDVLRRGFKAIEAFGDTRSEQATCVLPAEHLLAVGFKTVRPHPVHPRLRLDLRTTLSWKEDVEMALDRLLGAVQKEPVLRPL